MAFWVLVAWVRTTLWLLRRLFPARYTDADPYKRLEVDPQRITHCTGPARRRGWVSDGDWDQSTTRFIDRPIPKAVEQHYCDGLDWEDTALTTALDDTELSAAAQTIERLHDGIEEHGYKSQATLLREAPDEAWNDLNDAVHPLANEIGVDIARDGSICWNMGGQHRLAVARVLEVETVTVQVYRRHRQWQSVRSRARTNGTTATDFSSHPDLAALRPDGG